MFIIQSYIFFTVYSTHIKSNIHRRVVYPDSIQRLKCYYWRDSPNVGLSDQ